MLSTPTKYLNHVISVLLLNYLFFELILHRSVSWWYWYCLTNLYISDDQWNCCMCRRAPEKSGLITDMPRELWAEQTKPNHNHEVNPCECLSRGSCYEWNAHFLKDQILRSDPIRHSDNQNVRGTVQATSRYRAVIHPCSGPRLDLTIRKHIDLTQFWSGNKYSGRRPYRGFRDPTHLLSYQLRKMHVYAKKPAMPVQLGDAHL